MPTLYDYHSFKVGEASFREKDVVYFGMLNHSLKTCILLLLEIYNRFCWRESFSIPIFLFSIIFLSVSERCMDVKDLNYNYIFVYFSFNFY